MSLVSEYIESFGGYDAAKEKSTTWMINHGENWKNIKDATLLEYRREHNIFEVGDSILTNDNASDGKVYIIEKNHHNEHFKIRSKDGFRYCRLWRIHRHATDAEIKAGHRL